jgi:adenosylmethionine-8-amino-7-oxononanoate aminotransferase
LKRLLPAGLSRVFYSDNGSTAVEVAIKMALQYWWNSGEERRVIVALENGYHGDTFGAMSASERGVFTDPFGDKLFSVERLPDPVAGGPAIAFRELLSQRSHDVAAIIVEPLLLGAGGMRMWSEEELRALRQTAHEAGVLFIADEVLTGFGRTGPLFACERAGVSPDIICLSKGLTGGFLPLGATVASEQVFSAFLNEDRHHTFFHGHSYTANPIACAAALTSISLLDDECERRRHRIEEIHRARITSLAVESAILHPRVLGTVAAFDIPGEVGYLGGAAAQLAQRCLEQDVLIRPLGNVVYLIPPYNMEEQDLHFAYDVITSSLPQRG